MNLQRLQPSQGRLKPGRKLLTAAGCLLQAALMLAYSPSPVGAADAVHVSGVPAVASLARPGVRVWPAPKQQAIVCAVHGMTQQSGCFESLAKRLNAAGFTLVAMDLRAHGIWYHGTDASQPRRKLDYSRSAVDLQELARGIKSTYPETPLYCIGESVGAGVTTLAASSYPNLFDGIILASAGTTPGFYNPLLVTRDFFEGITNLDRQLDISGYITRYSSEDARITREMITDELSRTTLTGREILKTAAFIRKTPQFASRLPHDTRVLVLQGADDQIVRLSSISSIMRCIPGSDRKLVVFPNCGHILLGTAYLKTGVVGALIDWLVKETTSIKSLVAVRHDG